MPPQPGCWLRYSLANIFLPRLALNCNPPHLCLLHNWDRKIFNIKGKQGVFRNDCLGERSMDSNKLKEF
jgi:hypothetical protein